MKKVLSVVLAILIIVLPSTHCFALSNDSQHITKEEAVKRLSDLYPNADVYIGENGIICIVDLSTDDSSSRENPTRSEYYPNGGSYRNFTAPLGWPADAGVPYSMVFLPADQTAALLSARLETSLISTIVSLLANHPASWVSTYLATNFSIFLSANAIVFLSVIGTYNLISWLDSAALITATNNNSTICITRASVYGFPSDIYTGWNGTYVSPSPYDSFNPSFHSGVYDVKY